MKGEDSHSYSEELVRDKAAEDAELRLQVGEEAPPWAEQTQQAWVFLRYHQGVRGRATRERAIATIAGAKVTGQTNAQNWQKNNKLSFT